MKRHFTKEGMQLESKHKKMFNIIASSAKNATQMFIAVLIARP